MARRTVLRVGLIVLAGGLPLLLGVLEELYLWPTSVVGVAVLDSEVTPKGSLIGMLLAWGVLALLAALVAIIRVSRDGSRPSLRLAGWILIVLGVVAAWDLPTAAVAGHLIHQAYPNAPTGTSSIRIGLFAISLLAPAGVALLAIRGSLIRHPAHGSDA